MVREKKLYSTFLYVVRNPEKDENFAVQSIRALADETGLSYTLLKKVFLKEMSNAYLGGGVMIWRLAKDEIRSRRRGRLTKRSSMSNRRY